VTWVADFLPVILAFLLGLTWGFMGAKDGKRLVFTVKTVVNPLSVEIKVRSTSEDLPAVGSPDAFTSADAPDELPSGEDPPPGEKHSPPGGQDPGFPGSGGGDDVT
jgi:hypothetical protein